MFLKRIDPTTRAVVGSLLLVALRRGVARLIDQFLTGAATLVAVLVLWAIGLPLALALIAPRSSHDLVGLFEGGIATFAVAGLLCVGSAVLAIGIPALYLRWAARRDGDERGQTIGKATMGFRVVRADGLPLTGGRLWLRDLMLGITVFFPAVILQALFTGLTGLDRGGYSITFLIGLGLLGNAANERLPHDHLASTRLIDLRAAVATKPTDPMGSIAEQA